MNPNSGRLDNQTRRTQTKNVALFSEPGIRNLKCLQLIAIIRLAFYAKALFKVLFPNVCVTIYLLF